MTDNHRVLLFLTPIVVVYVLAVAIGVRALLNRLAHRATSFGPIRRWSHRIVLFLALVGLICMAYGYFVEPYWPSITRVQVKTAKLAAGSRPIRITHLSRLTHLHS
jgi:hypothetical protein